MFLMFFLGPKLCYYCHRRVSNWGDRKIVYVAAFEWRGKLRNLKHMLMNCIQVVISHAI
jgi:hypothetical protein